MGKLIRTGINFQKASSTLDGCVKIWTSRVDSVATETGKLLSGLAGGGGGGDGEDDEDGEEGGEGEEGRPKTRKVSQHSKIIHIACFHPFLLRPSCL